MERGKADDACGLLLKHVRAGESQRKKLAPSKLPGSKTVRVRPGHDGGYADSKREGSASEYPERSVLSIDDYQPTNSFERQLRNYKAKLATAAVKDNHATKNGCRSLNTSRAYLHRLLRRAEQDPLIEQEGLDMETVRTFHHRPYRIFGKYPVLRRFFSFLVMLASLLAMLAVLTVRQRFDDPDTWWHRKTGEVIWTIHTNSNN